MRLLIVAMLLMSVPVSVAMAEPDSVHERELAEERDRRHSFENALAVKDAASRIEAAVTEQAYNRFEIWTGLTLGLFSVFITILVLVFGFRTERAAATAAATAAQKEIMDVQALMHQLVSKAETTAQNAEVAAQNALTAASAAQDAALAAESRLDDVTKSATTAAKSAAELEKLEQNARAGADISQKKRNEASERSSGNVGLSPIEQSLLSSVATDLKEKDLESWTADDLKSAIGEATLVSKSWIDVVKYADILISKFPNDEESKSFALISKADAYIHLNMIYEARDIFEEIVYEFGGSDNIIAKANSLSAQHGIAYCLNEDGKTDEAEKRYKILVPEMCEAFGNEDPKTISAMTELGRCQIEKRRLEDALEILVPIYAISEKINGALHANTLVIGHNIGLAYAYLKVFDKAVVHLHHALLGCEQADGSDSPGTHVTRYWLALALMGNGRIEECGNYLDRVAATGSIDNWPMRWQAEYFFISGRYCDQIGEFKKATTYLERSRMIYRSVYRDDHPDVADIVDYMKTRLDLSQNT